jgi:hypothetical protein
VIFVTIFEIFKTAIPIVGMFSEQELPLASVFCRSNDLAALKRQMDSRNKWRLILFSWVGIVKWPKK